MKFFRRPLALSVSFALLAVATSAQDTWMIELALEDPKLEPAAVQFALFETDPRHAFASSVSRMAGYYRDRLGEAKDEARRRMLISSFQTVSWNIGFERIKGNEMHLLVGGEQGGLTLSANSPAGRRWIVTKVRTMDGTPICWSVEVRTSFEESARVVLRPENRFGLQAAYERALGVAKEPLAETTDETEVIAVEPVEARVLPPGVEELDLVRLRELYHLTDTLGDELWPGFDTRHVPIALNIDDQRELLISHPDPPSHFAPLPGIAIEEASVLLRDGVTRYGPRGGGWAITLGGEETVYVCTMGETGDTEGYLGLMLHEAFHVYQKRYRERGDGKWGELPEDDPLYSALIGLESRILSALLAEPDDGKARELARMFVAVRHERRRDLAEDVVHAEGEAEYSEGTATYCQARMLHLLAETDGLAPAIEAFDPRYGGFADAKERYAEFLQRILPAPGQVITFFHSQYNLGMAQGLVLDRVRPDWKEEMREKGMTQFALLERTFPLTEDEEYELFLAAEERFEFGALLEEQEDLVEARLALIRGYLEAPGTRYRIHHGEITQRFMWKPKGPVYTVPSSLLDESAPGDVTIWAGGMDSFERGDLTFVAEGVPIIFRHDFMEWIDGEPAADGSDFVLRSEREEDGVHHGLHIETDGFTLDVGRARIETREGIVDIIPVPGD